MLRATYQLHKKDEMFLRLDLETEMGEGDDEHRMFYLITLKCPFRELIKTKLKGLYCVVYYNYSKYHTIL